MWIWIVGIIGYLAALVVIFALCNAAKMGDRQSDHFDPDRAFEPGADPSAQDPVAKPQPANELPEEKPSILGPTS